MNNLFTLKLYHLAWYLPVKKLFTIVKEKNNIKDKLIFLVLSFINIAEFHQQDLIGLSCRGRQEKEGRGSKYQVAQHTQIKWGFGQV
jgi:hypothetical protein